MLTTDKIMSDLRPEHGDCHTIAFTKELRDQEVLHLGTTVVILK